jgi:Recombinase
MAPLTHQADFENDLTDYIILGVESERSFKESKYKSERVGSAWKTKKLKATCDHAITPKVPGWLTAKTGQPIKVIPERAEIVRKIFRLASMGLGARRIADRLTEDGDLAFGKAGWIISYIKKILANRATLGEYQPHKTVDGKRSFDGDTVLNYFPAVITQTQWDAVRKSIANKNRQLRVLPSLLRRAPLRESNQPLYRSYLRLDS